MKSILILAIFCLSQFAFALSGTLPSRVLGEKSLSVHFENLETNPSPVTATVSIDQDTRDMSCFIALNFDKAVMATYNLDDLQIKETQNLSLHGPITLIQHERECVSSDFQPEAFSALALDRSGHVAFVISEKRNNRGQTEKLMLRLALPREFATAQIQPVGAYLYKLSQLNMESQPLTVNFSVYTTTPGSVSYLEHGTVVIR